jgi:protein arginine N-methyltransferase 1
VSRASREPSSAGNGTWAGAWFDAVLAEGIGFSNAPDRPELIYGHAFFPWSEPVALDDGDMVTVALHADLVGDDYLWRWDTRVLGPGNPKNIKADFRQSSFFGTPLSPQHLRARSSIHVPILGEEDRSIGLCYRG